EIVALREIALADAAPGRRPVVALQALQAGHGLARVLGLDAGERHDVALGAANGLLLEFLEAARARGLGEDRERQEQSGERGQPHSAISTMHSISTGMLFGSEPMPTAERAC